MPITPACPCELAGDVEMAAASVGVMASVTDALGGRHCSVATAASPAALRSASAHRRS